MINNIKFKSEFTKNVLTLMTGTTIAQALPIAISPILTRIYTPEDFGVFALYMAIASIVSIIATGRYEMAIMLPKKDSDAINIVILSILISFFISFISFFIVFIFNSQITSLLNNPEISNWLYFIPITVLLTGSYQSFNYWLNRKKQYKELSTSRVIQSGTTVTTNLSMGFNGSGSSGLIVGGLIGQSVATMILAKMVWSDDQEKVKDIKKLKIVALANKYIDYPKKSSIGALFNALAYQGEIILLSIFYSSHLLGLFYFVNKFINIPKQFLSTSIWQVFLSNTGNHIEYVFSAKFFKQKKIIVYSTVPMIYGIFIYTDLFIFIFGEDWKNATVFIAPLIVAMNINFIVASFSLFLIINNPKAEMIFNIFLALLKVSSIVLSYIVWKNIFYTIIVFSLVQFIMFYILGTWNYKQLGKNYLFFTKLYLPYFLIGLLFLSFSEWLFFEEALLSKIGIYLFVITLYFGVVKYAKI